MYNAFTNDHLRSLSSTICFAIPKLFSVHLVVYIPEHLHKISPKITVRMDNYK